jgi:hypothetical protein
LRLRQYSRTAFSAGSDTGSIFLPAPDRFPPRLVFLVLLTNFVDSRLIVLDNYNRRINEMPRTAAQKFRESELIVYRFTPDGGFVAGDTESRLTAYAYPDSTCATQAKRNPPLIARHMISQESASFRKLASVRDYDARNWQEMYREVAR